MLNHTEMTKHIRNRLKAQGIKARVRKFTACGVRYVQVFAPAHGATFAAEEMFTIAHVADCNRLTGAQGAKIDPAFEAGLTGKNYWSFEFHG